MTKIKLIRNVGCFKQLTCDETFKQTTLIYGENAAGKMTLSSVLRSLARNASNEILARRRWKFASKPPTGSRAFRTGVGSVRRSRPRSSFLTIFSLSVKRDHFCPIVLSAGDRRTLALAYFFAALEKVNLEKAIVVFDDPFTSLNEHRMSATAEHIAGLQSQCRQLIVASHSKPFLKKVCGKLKVKEPLCLKLSRFGSENALQAESKKEWEKNDYDRHFATLRDFYEKNEGAPAVVGAVLRSVLEGYGRVAFQPYFPSGAMLGGFIEKERKRQAAGTSQIRVDLDELEELDALRDASNEFKHFNDASAADVNVGELRGLVKRVLTFVGYRPKEPA